METGVLPLTDIEKVIAPRTDFQSGQYLQEYDSDASQSESKSAEASFSSEDDHDRERLWASNQSNFILKKPVMT